MAVPRPPDAQNTHGHTGEEGDVAKLAPECRVGGGDGEADQAHIIAALVARQPDGSAAQGSGVADAALALARGEEVDKLVYVPFEPVTSRNIDAYLAEN